MEIKHNHRTETDPRGRPPGSLPRPLACTPLSRSRVLAFRAPLSSAAHCRPRVMTATIASSEGRDGPAEPGDD